jgi:hypothetical protein
MKPVEAFFLLVIVGLVAFFVAVAVQWWLAPAPSRPTPAAPPAPPAEPSPWIALPGGRLELGGTGFAITLNTGHRGYLYHLWSPEGRLLLECSDLPHIKHMGQRLAAERAEFACASLPDLQRFLH